MSDRPENWARLLPDHRTLYLSLDELEEHRRPGESTAEALLRSLGFAEHALQASPEGRALVHELMRRAGIPHEDPLGVELATALVVRGLFLREHPQILQVLVEEGDPSQ